MFKNKTLLITGGTGSFGKAFTKYILEKSINFRKVVLFSRDEFKQSSFYDELKKSNYKNFDKKVRFILGDIRDKERLRIAFREVDFVIHAAALKQVPAAEYNPIEFVNTNIIGAQNIVEACFDSKISKVIALSTDKAVAPKNFYGATKLCSDKLFLSANNIIGKKNISFSIVRYGNVDGSRGSVIPLFLKNKQEKKKLPVTELNMTRFSISMENAIKLVIQSLKSSIGGEIFIPKLKSYSLKSLVEAIKPEKGYYLIGQRPGEKMHEELINYEESEDVYDFKKFYVLFGKNLISSKAKNFQNKYIKFKTKKKFSYNSLECKKLSSKELKKVIFYSN